MDGRQDFFCQIEAVGVTCLHFVMQGYKLIVLHCPK